MLERVNRAAHTAQLCGPKHGGDGAAVGGEEVTGGTSRGCTQLADEPTQAQTLPEKQGKASEASKAGVHGSACMSTTVPCATAARVPAALASGLVAAHGAARRAVAVASVQLAALGR